MYVSSYPRKLVASGFPQLHVFFEEKGYQSSSLIQNKEEKRSKTEKERQQERNEEERKIKRRHKEGKPLPPQKILVLRFLFICRLAINTVLTSTSLVSDVFPGV
jgi:polynucleotide 5'-kinase involved in rRNA processing